MRVSSDGSLPQFDVNLLTVNCRQECELYEYGLSELNEITTLDLH